MFIGQRCGTGNSGCNIHTEAIQYMPTNMCNGVFAPVCAPEVCNVPRIPHQETLAEGQGIFLDDTTRVPITLNLFVERIMQTYRGKLEFQNPTTSTHLIMDDLKFFESDGSTHLIALFHNSTTNSDTMLTLYQDPTHHTTKLFLYSISMTQQVTSYSGMLTSGMIHLYPDHNVHDH